MKISENELEQSVINKLNQLEKVKTNSIGSTYITYENNEFVKKTINDLNISKVITSDEIFQLSKHLYKSEDNYASSYDTVMVNNSNAYSTSTMLNTLSGSFTFQTDSNIYKIKTYNTFIIVLCYNGLVYKIDRANPSIQTKKAILDVIKTNFVYQNFDIYSIVDFDYFNDGILVASEKNGIFFISLEREEASLVSQELYIRQIKVLSDRKTLLITKNQEKANIVLFNLELGKKLAAYNQLGIDNQIPYCIELGTDEFFILGKSNSVNQSEKLVHYWKLDDAKIDYENKDRAIANNPSDNSYRPKLIKTNSSTVFVIGIKNKSLFIWEYDKNSLNTPPIELIFSLQDFEFDDLNDFCFINNKYYITLKNRILVLDKNFNLLENYLLNGQNKFSSVKITASGIYACYDKMCYSFIIPEKIYQETVDIKILSNEGDCNNIDIMIKAPSKDNILILNEDTNQKIIPYFYIKMDNSYHIIKLLNSCATNIILRIGVTDKEDKIGAVVVHKNRIFYK